MYKMATDQCQYLCEPLVNYQQKQSGLGPIRDKRRFYMAVGVMSVCVLAAVTAAILIVNSNILNYPSIELHSLISTKHIVTTSPSLERAAIDPKSLNVLQPSKDDFLEENHIYSLLIIVDSKPEAIGERMTARQTWMDLAKSFGKDVLIRFAIPASDSKIRSEQLDSLRGENRIHKDMLLFRDMSSLPESEVVLFEMVWAEQYIAYSYLMKTRDNFYPHLPRLLQDVDQLKKDDSNVYWGYFEGQRSSLSKDQKHEEPEWFLCDTYIRYAHAGAYVLSRKLVKRLVSQIPFLHPYVNEDVAMGVWLSPFDDVDWKHDIRFDSEIGNSRGCSDNFVVFQDSHTLDLSTIHSHLALSEKICIFEHVSYTYEYDFNAPPSQCCRDTHL